MFPALPAGRRRPLLRTLLGCARLICGASPAAAPESTPHVAAWLLPAAAAAAGPRQQAANPQCWPHGIRCGGAGRGPSLRAYAAPATTGPGLPQPGADDGSASTRHQLRQPLQVPGAGGLALAAQDSSLWQASDAQVAQRVAGMTAQQVADVCAAWQRGRRMQNRLPPPLALAQQLLERFRQQGYGRHDRGLGTLSDLVQAVAPWTSAGPAWQALVDPWLRQLVQQLPTHAALLAPSQQAASQAASRQAYGHLTSLVYSLYRSSVRFDSSHVGGLTVLLRACEQQAEARVAALGAARRAGDRQAAAGAAEGSHAAADPEPAAGEASDVGAGGGVPLSSMVSRSGGGGGGGSSSDSGVSSTSGARSQRQLALTSQLAYGLAGISARLQQAGLFLAPGGLGASELHACATATLTAVCDCAARELPAPGPPTATGQEALAVANLAWAVATHGLFHKRLLLAMARTVQQLPATDVAPRHAARIAWSYGRLRYHHRSMLDHLATCYLHHAAAQRAAGAGHAGAASYAPKGAKRVRSAPGAGLVDTQLISNMAWGYAVVDHQHEELLHLLGDQARACMQALKPLELCNVLFAFAVLDWHDPQLLAAAQLRVSSWDLPSLDWTLAGHLLRIHTLYQLMACHPGLPRGPSQQQQPRQAEQDQQACGPSQQQQPRQAEQLQQPPAQAQGQEGQGQQQRLWQPVVLDTAARVGPPHAFTDFGRVKHTRPSERPLPPLPRLEQVSAPLFALPAGALPAMRRVFESKRTKPAFLPHDQREVWRVLTQALGRPTWSEVELLGGELHVDILTTYRGHAIAVEVDGPYHYTRNMPAKREGATVLRDRMIRLAGLPLVTIPHHQWKDMRRREPYLHTKLHCAAEEAEQALRQARAAERGAGREEDAAREGQEPP